MPISFQNTDHPFKLPDKRIIREWILSEIRFRKKTPGQLNFVFCSDDYLLEVNKKYLSHDYFTDIITFDYSEKEQISGDLLISIDRVKENASSLNLFFLDEVHRVLIHGILHLCGFKDKTPEQEELMRIEENSSLARLKKFECST